MFRTTCSNSLFNVRRLKGIALPKFISLEHSQLYHNTRMLPFEYNHFVFPKRYSYSNEHQQQSLTKCSRQFGNYLRLQNPWKGSNMKMESLIQAAEECFKPDASGIIKPTQGEITKLRHMMESFQLSDLGFNQKTLTNEIKKLNNSEDTIHFINFHETPWLCVVAFILLKGQKLPLHDHMGMVVISKIIMGRCKLCAININDLYEERFTDLSPNQQNEAIRNYNNFYRELPIGNLIEGHVLFNTEVPLSKLSQSNDPISYINTPEDNLSNQFEDLIPSHLSEEIGSSASTTLSNGIETVDSFGFSSETDAQSQYTQNIFPCLEFPSTIMVLPDVGNIHEIESIQPITVFLDILSPSYYNRHSNFYSVISPQNLTNARGKIKLQVTDEQPESFSEIHIPRKSSSFF